MRFSVCLDALYKGKDILDSIRAVKASGLTAIEFWGWENKDMEALSRVCREEGLAVAAFCAKMGSLVQGLEKEAYLAGLRASVNAARSVGCKTLIGLTGNEAEGLSRTRQHENLVESLKNCAPVLEEAGVQLVLEPLNIIKDHKGYYLSRSEEAFEIVEKVGSAQVKVLFDIYHQQITEGNLIANITANVDKIGHFHAAGNPGRHELDNGEIHYPSIFRAIDAAGYKGFIGLEYFPLEEVSEGLAKLAELSRR